jgi:hypothetical protein
VIEVVKKAGDDGVFLERYLAWEMPGHQRLFGESFGPFKAAF